MSELTLYYVTVISNHIIILESPLFGYPVLLLSVTLLYYCDDLLEVTHLKNNNLHYVVHFSMHFNSDCYDIVFASVASRALIDEVTRWGEISQSCNICLLKSEDKSDILLRIIISIYIVVKFLLESI